MTVITGKTALFEPYLSLQDSDHAVFTSLDLATILFLKEQGCRPCETPNLEDHVSVLFPRCQGDPRHRIPFSSPSTTRRAMVEEF
jgi:hypothetical protein